MAIVVFVVILTGQGQEMQRRTKRGGGNKLLETAVFLDAAAYNKLVFLLFLPLLLLLSLCKTFISRFASYFLRIGKKNVDVEVRRLMLSYLNGIQVCLVINAVTFDI